MIKLIIIIIITYRMFFFHKKVVNATITFTTIIIKSFNSK